MAGIQEIRRFVFVFAFVFVCVYVFVFAFVSGCVCDISCYVDTLLAGVQGSIYIYIYVYYAFKNTPVSAYHIGIK